MMTRHSRVVGCVVLGLMALMLAACGLDGKGGSNGGELGSVEYSYTFAFKNLQRQVSISREGELEVMQSTPEGRQAAKVQLSQEQRSRIAEAFSGWGDLKPYYQVIFGPTIIIVYNGKKVESSGGEDTPANFLKAKAVLDQVADALIAAANKESARTRPATAPAATP